MSKISELRRDLGAGVKRTYLKLQWMCESVRERVWVWNQCLFNYAFSCRLCDAGGQLAARVPLLRLKKWPPIWDGTLVALQCCTSPAHTLSISLDHMTFIQLSPGPLDFVWRPAPFLILCLSFTMHSVWLIAE